MLKLTGRYRLGTLDAYHRLLFPGLTKKATERVVTRLLKDELLQSFPLHAYPYDYFRFSREALASLFGTSMGVDVVATNYDFPVQLYTRRVPGMQLHPAFLNTTLWAEKREATPEEYRYEL